MNSKENIEIISSLRNVTEIVKEALDKNAYRAAFFCSLSIPDICGQLFYPDLRGNNSSTKRYKKWYNENIYQYEHPEKDIEYVDPLIDKYNLLDGDMIWLIRCKLYHQGLTVNDEVIKKLKNKYKNSFKENFDKIQLNINLDEGRDHFRFIYDNFGADTETKMNIDIFVNQEILAKKLLRHAENILKKEKIHIKNFLYI